MKFDELRPCDLCESPVSGNTREGKFGRGKSIDFHRIVVEHHILNARAINERVGLMAMLGGSEQIAGAFASQDDASTPAVRTELLICSPCWLEKDGLQELLRALEADKGKTLPNPEADRVLERAHR